MRMRIEKRKQVTLSHPLGQKRCWDSHTSHSH